jgi:hypothetical protein
MLLLVWAGCCIQDGMLSIIYMATRLFLLVRCRQQDARCATLFLPSGFFTAHLLSLLGLVETKKACPVNNNSARSNSDKLKVNEKTPDY